MESGEKAISELAKKPVGITALPSLSASACLHFFLPITLSKEKNESVCKHWAHRRCIFIQFRLLTVRPS